jgi:phosphoribosylanthranilate isomerase
MTYKLIKVCGMREAENIREVENLGIDLMGFIFWPKSKRYVNEFPEYMPVSINRVGVFVNEDIEQVKQIAEDYALDIIQLHGSESPQYAQALREWEIIKAFNIESEKDLEATKPYEGIVDYFLFDTKGPSVGGNGEKFDWEVLSAYDGQTPFLLSGGIGPNDADRLLAFHHPRCIGIDLNSRFEISPGLKDVAALRQFLAQLHQNSR